MSQENVELIKALYPEPHADIAELFRDDDAFAQLREVLGPLLTDDFESVMHGGVIQNRTHAGLEGFRRNWLDWLEPWETYRSTIDELIDAGDDVVLLLRDYGRRKGTDREVEVIGASVATFREGKLARWVDYADRVEALEAVGLRE